MAAPIDAGPERTGQCDVSEASNELRDLMGQPDVGVSFAEELARRVGEMCKSLVHQYEDALSEKHAVECNRIRNEALRREALLRADIGVLREKSASMAEAVMRLSSKTTLSGDPSPIARGSNSSGDAGSGTDMCPSSPKEAHSMKVKEPTSWQSVEEVAPEADALIGGIPLAPEVPKSFPPPAPFGAEAPEIALSPALLPGSVLVETIGDTTMPSLADAEQERPDGGESLAKRNPNRQLSDPSMTSFDVGSRPGPLPLSSLDRRASRSFPFDLMRTKASRVMTSERSLERANSLLSTFSKRANLMGLLTEGPPSRTSRYMLHPNSRASLMKDGVAILCVVWDMITLPYILAWNPDEMGGIKVVATMVSLFWTSEMFITMNTGFFREGELEMNRRAAISHYLRRWFLVDVITVGFDWVGFLFEALQPVDTNNKGIHVLRFLKMNRLLRVARAFRVMKIYERLTNVGHSFAIEYLASGSTGNMLLKVVQYALAIFWLNHVVGCAWFALGNLDPATTDTGMTWLDAHTLQALDEYGFPENGTLYRDLPPLFQYTSCLHVAVTMTVFGGININPTNGIERALTTCGNVVGFLLTSMLVSSLSSWLVQVQISKQEKVATMSTLRRYLRENAVTGSLASRLDRYVLERMWVKPKLRESEVAALEFLTPALRNELRRDLYSKHILTNPLVRTWDLLDSHLVEALCSSLIPVSQERGRKLFNPKSMAGRAFYLVDGKLGYTKAPFQACLRAATTQKSNATMPLAMTQSASVGATSAQRIANNGAWIAEVALWVHWTFVGTAEARTDCQLLELSREAVSIVVSERPHLHSTMRHYAEAYEQELTTKDYEDMDDLAPCVEHAAVVMAMEHRHRLDLCFAVLRALRQRHSIRSKMDDSVERLERELLAGSRALIYDKAGNMVQVKRSASLRLRRPDGRVLVQIAVDRDGGVVKDPKLPSRVLVNEEPEEGLMKLLGGDFAFVGSAMTFGQVSTYTTIRPSRTFASLALTTLQLNTLFCASVGDDFVLPHRLDLLSAMDYLQRATFSTNCVQVLHEVHKLRNGDGDDTICAWVDDQTEDEAMLTAQNTTLQRPSLMKRNASKEVPPDAGGIRLTGWTGPTRVPVSDQLLNQQPGLTGVPLLRSLMKGRGTDWHRARRMATQICDPDYTCEDFFKDVVASFPELGLYTLGSGASMQETTCGRTTDDEYQRTIGAFFSLFWLMRLDLDGADSFSFGLDENWEPRTPPNDVEKQCDEVLRRINFRQKADWISMQQLLVDSGLLKSSAAASESPHDPERTLAMLSLTAYHDIMKISALLPTVAAEHGCWCGFEAGEVIDDHDAALAYILEYYPDLLPSFTGLPLAGQRSVRFTQCKMEYNMGWLVQAEAPPGALLSTLRKMSISGMASGQDLCFYFVHWLIDLAGAVPTPLAGSEKFVLGFPLKVLSAFLKSFPIIRDLGNATSESRVYENYLRWRWDTHKPPLGRIPEGFGSIAKMRLVIMAQGNSKLLLSAWTNLPEEDRRVLGEELARTGCEGQLFECDTLSNLRGPAFLIYYGPAFLQKAGLLDPLGAMRIFAEILRKARAMWPLKSSLSGVTVSVRIDTLKAETVQSCSAPRSGEAWCLERVSERSCAVSLMKLSTDDTEDWSSRCVLNFANCCL